MRIDMCCVFVCCRLNYVEIHFSLVFSRMSCVSYQLRVVLVSKTMISLCRISLGAPQKAIAHMSFDGNQS